MVLSVTFLLVCFCISNCF